MTEEFVKKIKKMKRTKSLKLRDNQILLNTESLKGDGTICEGLSGDHKAVEAG